MRAPFLRLAILAFALVGCVEVSRDATPLGVVHVGLTGTSSSGAEYRLVSARFAISGPTNVELWGSPPVIVQQLPAGPYAIFLQSGWTLERRTAADYAAIDAELISPNPTEFQIASGVETRVAFRFRAGGEVVVLDNGTLSVSILVDEVSDAGARDGGPGEDGGDMRPDLDGSTDADTQSGTGPISSDAELGTALTLAYLAPLEGQVAEPGSNVLVRIAGTRPGAVPTLRMGGAPVSVVWAEDAEGSLRTKVLVPRDTPPGQLEVVALAEESRAAVVHLRVLSPLLSGTQTTATSFETSITHPSGLIMRIAPGALPQGATASVVSFDARSFPRLDGARTLSPVYGVHVSVDPAEVTAPFMVEQALSPAQASELQARAGLLELTLEVLEGDDVDPEAASWNEPAAFVIDAAGNGVLRAELPSAAFHATGSANSNFVFVDEQQPYTVRDLRVCQSKASTMPECHELLRGDDGLLRVVAGAEVRVSGTIEWLDSPPALQNPLAEMVVTSAYNPRRCLSGEERAHNGVDLRAAVGTTANAGLAGTASVVFNFPGSPEGHLYVVVGRDNWHLQYFHLSEVVDFSRHFNAGEVIGLQQDPVSVSASEPPHPALAPVAGDYTLSCSEIVDGPCNVRKHRALCKVETQVAEAGEATRTVTVDNLVSLTANAFTRQVDAGAPIGKTGSTGACEPHLHYEVRYKRRHGHALDPALFYPSISASTLVNDDDYGSVEAVESPARRVAIAIDQFGLLGIGSDRAVQYPTVCARGEVDGYRPQKLVGPPQKTSFEWDFGPCIHSFACEGSPPGLTMPTTLRVVGQRWSQRGPNQCGSAINGPRAWRTHPSQFDDQRKIALSCCLAEPGDFEGATISVAGTTAFAASAMTIKGVRRLLSGTGAYAGLPAVNIPPAANNLRVFTWNDTFTAAGTAGFPTVIYNNPINTYGASNVFAVWEDPTGEWQWTWQVSGGSKNYVTGNEREYVFIYDSRQTIKYRFETYTNGVLTSGITDGSLAVEVRRPEGGKCMALPDAFTFLSSED